jgi:hypothetical protein
LKVRIKYHSYHYNTIIFNAELIFKNENSIQFPYFENTKDTLTPPNPKEFFIALLIIFAYVL